MNTRVWWVAIGGLTLCLGCSQTSEAEEVSKTSTRADGRQRATYEKATFAGGCFWCMEKPFDDLNGVIRTTAGYTGGRTKNPSYDEVSRGNTGHAEAVEIVFDPKKISYRKLLEVFWHNIDPTVRDRQFCDVGTQYRSVIFYHDAKQKKLALASKKEIERKKTLAKPLQTQITKAGPFYKAEDNHQDFYKKQPLRYQQYQNACGRKKRLEQLWSEPP